MSSSPRLPPAVSAVVAASWSSWLLLLAAPPPPAAAQTLSSITDVILGDLVEQYSTYGASVCSSSSSTTHGFDFPGTNADSDWSSGFVDYEEGMFQAWMSHADDTGDSSWTVRFGTGGNIYSHYAPDRHGETMPPQERANSPWVDEVQQSISVNEELNQVNSYNGHPEFCSDGAAGQDCKAYFVHQAGVYMDDSPHTDTPFHSPSLAKKCSGDTCIFASWGQSAHVPSPFTSPIININRYTNCGDGVIEHTQMLHNFADPFDSQSTADNIDQTYFNIGWGGPRKSVFPFALEPDPVSGALAYEDVNNVDYLYMCPWGSDGEGDNSDAGTNWRGQREDLKNLGGYTTFVQDGLKINMTDVPELQMPCRTKAADCTNGDYLSCMTGSCTQDQIDNDGYERLRLRVTAGNKPACQLHPGSTDPTGKYPILKCNFHDTGFGRSTVTLQDAVECAPWTNNALCKTGTNECLKLSYVWFWSNRWDTERTWFSIYETDGATARSTVDNFFDNTNGAADLEVEARPMGRIESVPADYEPSSLSAFTYIYGDESQYTHGGGTIGGGVRRRVGPSRRDYNVFTINWHRAQARLTHGQTYANRGFYAVGDLGSAKSTADAWRGETLADKIDLGDWNPRGVKIYKFEHSDTTAKPLAFTIRIASSAGADHVQGCGSGGTIYTSSCTGWSTPKSGGYVPYFQITCGTSSYIGPDPYYYAPDFGGSFPGHGNVTSPVRAYVCDGQSDVRPEMKLLGFFDPDDCPATTGLAHDRYACAICRNEKKADWYIIKRNRKQGCSWIAKSPTFRCPRWSGYGDDKRLAMEACGKVCNPYCA